MDAKQIIEAQLDFYRNNKAGCAFAGLAAKNPEIYGWFQRIIPSDSKIIDAEIKAAIAASNVTTLSLIFPEVNTSEKLLELINTFCNVAYSSWSRT